MASDKVIGAGILGGSILGIIVYAILLFFFSIIVLEITAFVGVVVLLGILAWIGWTMATTPAPEPITDISPQPTMGAGTEQPKSGQMSQDTKTETK